MAFILHKCFFYFNSNVSIFNFYVFVGASIFCERWNDVTTNNKNFVYTNSLVLVVNKLNRYYYVYTLLNNYILGIYLHKMSIYMNVLLFLEKVVR